MLKTKPTFAGLLPVSPNNFIITMVHHHHHLLHHLPVYGFFLPIFPSSHSKMEPLPRLSQHVLSLSSPKPNFKFFLTPFLHLQTPQQPTSKPGSISPNPLKTSHFFHPTIRTLRSSTSPKWTTKAGWLLGLGEKKQQLPDLVKAGDPVLHEPAQEVDPKEIGSERIQKIIDDMVQVMRKPPGVGLAAPQIGIPLRIIVLEDTKEYISYGPKEEIKAQDRRPFDLLVIVNPKLKKKSNRTALFFEGCLSVDGYRAVVERYLDVQVTGLDRYGQPITVDASGWQARILQHECDHLEGTLYVDKMLPKTFRTVENRDLPLAAGCPKLGPR